jgi:hypothetical protein
MVVERVVVVLRIRMPRLSCGNRDSIQVIVAIVILYRSLQNSEQVLPN